MANRSGPLPFKLLLNAEGFGFGPTAAIADFFPHLRKHFAYMGFAGSGHCLDLQRSFDYDAINDLEKEDFEQAVSKYDLFFTALDFERAAVAVKLGKGTIIYDSLTWYWPEIHPVAFKDVLYLAQAFHGVKEVIEKNPFSNPVIISPITPSNVVAKERSLVMINMGGLQNPFWTTETCLLYAHMVINAFDAAYQGDDPVVILTSKTIAQELNDPRVTNKNRDEVVAMLPQVKYALQTAGLSNIYDSAIYDIPTLFLPPANDSQGRQLELLIANQQADLWINWEGIDYKTSQKEILKNIAAQIKPLLLKEPLLHLSRLTESRTKELIKQFGTGGAKQAAQQVIKYAQHLILISRIIYTSIQQ